MKPRGFREDFSGFVRADPDRRLKAARRAARREPNLRQNFERFAGFFVYLRAVSPAQTCSEGRWFKRFVRCQVKRAALQKGGPFIVSLAPATYTVQVKSADGAPGAVLVEVYDLQ